MGLKLRVPGCKVGRYASPRWTQEITDCSMPMTFDTYSACSYRCLYCFAFFRKAIGNSKGKYMSAEVEASNPETLRRIIDGEIPHEDQESGYWQFQEYARKRRVIQWGGLSDPFDEYERRYGVSLRILRMLREREYPVSFSTKATWFSKDPRYVELLRGAREVHFKVSIITLDRRKARVVEDLCPTPESRLACISRLAKMGIGGVTLRLRPFIIGISSPTYLELIRRAADAGADSISTEFLCLEERSRLARNRYEVMSRMAGVDLLKMYKSNPPPGGESGYLRLRREVKRPYMEAMAEQCEKVGVRMYVSDVHFKELCANGSCCGLSEEFNYSRGQFTEALLIAKRKGKVRWADIEGGLDYAEGFLYRRAVGFNQNSSENRAQFHNFSMRDWLQWVWNNPKSRKSPFVYFGGRLRPTGIDEDGNLVYEYVEDVQ